MPKYEPPQKISDLNPREHEAIRRFAIGQPKSSIAKAQRWTYTNLLRLLKSPAAVELNSKIQKQITDTYVQYLVAAPFLEWFRDNHRRSFSSKINKIIERNESNKTTESLAPFTLPQVRNIKGHTELGINHYHRKMKDLYYTEQNMYSLPPEDRIEIEEGVILVQSKQLLFIWNNKHQLWKPWMRTNSYAFKRFLEAKNLQDTDLRLYYTEPYKGKRNRTKPNKPRVVRNIPTPTPLANTDPPPPPPPPGVAGEVVAEDGL
jgi:hypothetical protein